MSRQSAMRIVVWVRPMVERQTREGAKLDRRLPDPCTINTVCFESDRSLVTKLTRGTELGTIHEYRYYNAALSVTI
jgi:hypothetical protein